MNKAKHSVEKMCFLLSVSRSAYYEWLKKEPQVKELSSIDKEVSDEFKASKNTYGSPRVCNSLNQKGIKISKSTVARIMKRLGIHARPRRKFIHTTDSKHDFKVFENILNRNFKSNQMNQKWVSDITYISTKQGWIYLTIILDLADRMIVSWSVSKDMTAQNTTVACLLTAMSRRKINKKLILHSDRGVQYCCFEFRHLVKKAKWINQSMSRKGNCWDNAPAESFFKTLKVEWTNRFQYEDVEEAKKSIFDYIERWYNTRRKHSSLDYMSPLQKHYFLNQTAA